MEKVVMIGVDVHDKDNVARVGVDKEPPQNFEFTNTLKGQRCFFYQMKRLAKEKDATKIVLAYEAGPLGFGLYDACLEAGLECVVLAPTKIERSVHSRKRKTDSEDAEKLLEVLRGHYLAGNTLPAIWIPSRELRDDRELVRNRLDVGLKITRLKGQIQSLLKRNGIRKPKEAGNSWTCTYWHWLWEQRITRGARSTLSSLLRQLEYLENEGKRLNKEIQILSQEPTYAAAVAKMTELSGVGLLTAMVYATEMGDLSRFKNRKSVGSFIGLSPSTHESGVQDDRKGHVTRQGPARVRRILTQAAWSRVRCDPNERQFFDRLVARNPKKKKIALVAVMRRLGIAMWRVSWQAQARELKQAA